MNHLQSRIKVLGFGQRQPGNLFLAFQHCQKYRQARSISDHDHGLPDVELKDAVTKSAIIADGGVIINGQYYMRDKMTNVTPTILAKVGRSLHHNPNHPLGIVKNRIHSHFHTAYRARYGGPVFAAVDNIDPVVTTEQNFDSLLVPQNHVSRNKNDNYYLNEEYLLRAHTSAHQRDLIRSGWDAFLVSGDVYRRDEIDRSHYPVFHQMEGVRVFSNDELFREMDAEVQLFEKNGVRTTEKQAVHSVDACRMAEFNLKLTLTKMVEYLFDDNVEIRWVDTYFPFTHPSWELEIKFGDEWMEMLGCGIMEHGIMEKAGTPDKIGWAFGLGLERFAMKLFEINDIRLFWSEDSRFLNQFNENSTEKFKPFSKFPPTYKDVSVWVSSDFTPNDLFDVVRGTAGDIVEEVKIIDEFVHPKSGRKSQCYRITYRAMDRTFTDDEINVIQERVRNEVKSQLSLELR